MEEFPIRDLVRQFPDRAFRWALDLPENVRGLLRLAEVPFVEDLDFSQMRPLKPSSIHDDLREEIPDVLHEVPLKVAPGRTIVVCILAEYSSSRVRWVRALLVEGIGNVWREQRLEWERRKIPEDQRVLKPVIAGVLYTGDEPWEEPPQLADEWGLTGPIGEYTLHFKQFFVDPHQLSEESLARPDEPFAWILKLFRDARAPVGRFVRTLRETLEKLGRLKASARSVQRRLAWIADIMAHLRRPMEERTQIAAVINQVLPQFVPAEEVEIMTQTIADYYVEQGVLQGKQHALLRLLESRFGQLPEGVKEKVLSLRDDEVLDDQLVGVLSAERLEDLALS